MRQVILQIDMSLDGFIAAPDGSIDFVKNDDVMNQDAIALLDTADTILLGRRAYQDFVGFWPHVDMNADSIASQVARHLNPATKLIFSRTLDRVEWGTYDNARLVKENVGEVIAEMKAQSGKNLLLYAGAGIANTFMRLGLIDAYRIRIHPVTLGKGLPLFNDVKLNLKPVSTKTYANGAIMLEYRLADA